MSDAKDKYPELFPGTPEYKAGWERFHKEVNDFIFNLIDKGMPMKEIVEAQATKLVTPGKELPSEKTLIYTDFDLDTSIGVILEWVRNNDYRGHHVTEITIRFKTIQED